MRSAAIRCRRIALQGAGKVRAREGGFTLVEVLAALVAGAFLLVAIGWNLSSLVRLLRDDPAEQRARHLAAIVPALEAWIEPALPVEFTGTNDHLSAQVPAPQAAGPVGLVRLTLSVRTGPDGQSLEAAFAPVEPDVRWPASARVRTLLSGYRTIRFEYVWAPQAVQRVLPRLVTLVLHDGATVRRLSFAPRLDSDGSCRFDPISMSCRP